MPCGRMPTAFPRRDTRLGCPPDPDAPPSAGSGRPAAVFDLDGTLTRRDTSLPFLRFVGSGGDLARALVVAAVCAGPDLWAAWRGEGRGGSGSLGSVAGRWEGRLHERTAGDVLRGRTEGELFDLGERFARVVEEGVMEGARRRIRDHAARGHRLVLASASLEIYVRPLASLLGFTDAVGTRLEFRGGVATGLFEGLPCWGEEKLRRVEALLGGDAVIHYAYGDSPGDDALLRAARSGTWVG